MLRSWYLEAMKDCLVMYKKTQKELWLNAAKDYGQRSKKLKEELDSMK